MKRPLLIVTIAYINGIIIGVYLQISILLIFISAISLIYFFIRKILKQKTDFIKIVSFYLLIMCFSNMQTEYINNEYNNKYIKLDNQEIEVVGTIISSIKEKKYKDVYIIKIDNINKSKKYKGDHLILNIKRNNNIKQKNTIKYGDKIVFKAIYEEPNTVRNYKGFNYKKYLKTKKIYGILNNKDINKIKILKNNNLSFFELSSNKFIQKLKENLKKVLSEDMANLEVGILVGYDEELDEQITQNFKNSNLSHMLVVSGAHVAYVILIINMIFKVKIFGKKNQKIITIILLIIFMYITGITPSVIRACCSYIIYILASLFYKKADIINCIVIPALITLISNPFNLFDIGMQLSYAGTIGILFLYKENKKFLYDNNYTDKEEIFLEKNKYNIFGLDKVLKYLKQTVIITIRANLLIIPIMIYYFNKLSLTFVFSNLLASPVLGVSVILGIITSITCFFSIFIAKFPATILSFFLNILNNIAKKFSRLSISQITISTIPICFIIVIYIIEGVIVYLLKNKDKYYYLRSKIKIKTIKISIVFCVILLILIIIFNKLPQNCLKIYFIDVGQGDSCLIKTNMKKIILIDGGGSKEADNFDIGSEVLLPYLLDRRIRYIDYIMVSHFDEDHAQGLEEVIKNIKVKNIIISKQAQICEQYKNIIKLCKEKQVKIIIVKSGNKIKIDNNTFFEILHPSDDYIKKINDINSNAIVCKLHYRNNSNFEYNMLFTGDIDQKAEEELAKIYGDKLKSDILKVAHHGSKTSNTLEFLKLVNPKIALIGVGENNNFGHPNEGVIKRLNILKTKIYRTDKNGEIIIKINSKILVKTMLKN